jgi:hypothetical protein
MNNRIRELDEQAADYCKTQPREMAGSMWEEKFAELIVRECAQIVNDNEFAGSTTGNQLLFEHFGIEKQEAV